MTALISTALRLPILLAALVLTGICLFAVSDSAEADVPIESFATVPSSSQAGGHPDVVVAMRWGSRFINPGDECHCGDAAEISVSLPQGLIGNPHAAPKCTNTEFALEICPDDSQIGIVELWAFLPWVLPVYNVTPRPGEPGLLAFQAPIFRTPQYVELSPRTDGDYGLDAVSPSINHYIPASGAKFDFWGVPADPKHDLLRISAAEQNSSGLDQAGLLCDADGETYSTNDPHTIVMRCGDFARKPKPYNGPAKPFMQNPTTCGAELTTTMDLIGYDHSTDHAESTYPAPTGCDQLSFNPSLAAQPTTTQADSPSGVDVTLTVPQFQSPTVPSPSSIEETTVTLPAGFTVNTNAADGKRSCSDLEAGLGTKGQAFCPEHSKVGTLEIVSAVLPGPLPGFIYLGEPKPGDRYRLILVADGFGVHVKLPGSVKLDPVTGQLVVSFLNLPETPFEEFSLHLFGSERGVLATPEKCGTYMVETTFAAWNSAVPAQTSKQFFTIDSGPGGGPCPGTSRPFAPLMKAGSADNTAGVHSPFVLTIDRPDGDQNLQALQVSTPPGFSGTLAGIPYCPESALTSLMNPLHTGLIELNGPACPAASQVGVATAGAGAGSRPLYVGGKVYLAGPYQGAPLSLVVVIPAVSGPYDLGNVAVRTAIRVDPVTALVTAVSDPLPQILDGIPLRTRSIVINLDRPEFARNPTNCNPLSVDATISGDEGAVAPRSALYQAANCASLPYAPKLSLKLTGGVKRRGHPAVHALLTAKPGEANTRGVQVALPAGELLDNSHIGTVCTRPQFAADACPAGALLGTGEATTPLLDAPLKGNVYLRSSSHELPDLAIDLEGQIDIEAVGVIDTIKGGSLRTTFSAIPDAPLTRFKLDLLGGAKGLLVNSKGLCGRSDKAKVTMTGQNGVRLERKAGLNPACGKARAKRKTKKWAGR